MNDSAVTSGGELPPLTDAEMDTLGELLAKASERPWFDATDTQLRRNIRTRERPVLYGLDLHDSSADVALIVAAVNALPRLLATIAAQRRVVEAAKACEESYECCDELTMRGTVPNYLMGNLMSALIALDALVSASPRSTKNE